MPLKKPEHNFWLKLPGTILIIHTAVRRFWDKCNYPWVSILHTLASVDTEARVGVGPAQ